MTLTITTINEIRNFYLITFLRFIEHLIMKDYNTQLKMRRLFLGKLIGTRSFFFYSASFDDNTEVVSLLSLCAIFLR